MKCPLCKSYSDDAAKFCGDCYERAGESVVQRESSVTASEQVVLVALTYLGPLYGGVRPPTVTKEVELACLAVTVAYDVRNYREKIAGLEAELQRLSQPTLVDRELVGLIKG
jgi:hypothetical protein